MTEQVELPEAQPPNQTLAADDATIILRKMQVTSAPGEHLRP